MVAAAGVVAVWAALVSTGPGQVVDEIAFAGSTRGRDLLDGRATDVLSLVSEGTLALGVVVLVVLAVLRRRLRLAVAAVALVGGANVTTQLLKHVVLERPDLGLGTANSLPSGHTTVAATLAVALVLVVPTAVRGPVALLGAVYTAATGVSTLAAGWHRPSDVVAALLVTASWTALVVAGLRLLGGPAPAHAGRGWAALLTAAGVTGAVLGVAGLLAAAAVLDATGTVVVASAAEDAGRGIQLLSYAGGVLASGGGSALLLGSVLALLRRTPD